MAEQDDGLALAGRDGVANVFGGLPLVAFANQQNFDVVAPTLRYCSNYCYRRGLPSWLLSHGAHIFRLLKKYDRFF